MMARVALKPGKFAPFPRCRRLARSREYQCVFSEGMRSVERAFVVLARPNALGFPRLGLAVSRKQLRGAVQRNRVKRLIRESFRRHQGELGQLDLVVIARKGVDAMATEEVFGVLQRHWAKVSHYSST
ncbi:MAG: ribonuclease P protein component [Gammaproteobacteria bacterium]